MGTRSYAIIVGSVFGQLTVLCPPYMRKPHMSCDCKCVCGAVTTVRCSRLVAGQTRSCGCVNPTKFKTTHGMSRTRIRQAWINMHARCYEPNNEKYLRYGARGIVVCRRWHDFNAFYEDMGDAPQGMTLDRIDNNNNYSKSNCRWATPRQQARNRSSNRLIEYEGVTKSLIEWSEYTGIKYITLQKRLQSNWPIKKLLSKPRKSQ